MLFTLFYNCHDITELLLKVVLNTINQPTNQPTDIQRKYIFNQCSFSSDYINVKRCDIEVFLTCRNQTSLYLYLYTQKYTKMELFRVGSP